MFYTGAKLAPHLQVPAFKRWRTIGQAKPHRNRLHLVELGPYHAKLPESQIFHKIESGLDANGKHFEWKVPIQGALKGDVPFTARSPWHRHFIETIRNTTQAKRAARRAFKLNQPELWNRASGVRKNAAIGRRLGRGFLYAEKYATKPPSFFSRNFARVMNTARNPKVWKGVAIVGAGTAAFELGRRYLKRRRLRRAPAA
jgi:hypothetical protein